MAKKREAKRKKRAQAQRTGTALAEPKRKVEELADLSEEGQALAFEIAANRSAILKLGGIVLEHEKRLGALESTLEDLAGLGDGEDVIELEAEQERDENEEEAQRFLDLPALLGGKPKGRKARTKKGKGT
jgi:hypothetical protein